MKPIFHNLFFSAIIICGLSAFAAHAQDRSINFNLKFAKGSTSATVSKKIIRGISHVYKFRARANQQISVNIKTGNKTSVSVYSVNSGVLENADGVKNFDGTLPDTGEYYVIVGTDAAANYTLFISIK